MKLRSKKGFTLMEMLIVVGIIAVLVAVSIPVFTSQLEKAREAADIANMRSAKAEGVAWYLTNEVSGTNTTRYYDAASGKLVTEKPAAYGKGTATTTGGTTKYDSYTDAFEAAGKVIKVVIGNDGDVSLIWE